jgi:hypothetical protein
MAWHDTKATDQGNLETAIPNNFGETSITQIFFFKFVTTGAAAPFEGAA